MKLASRFASHSPSLRSSSPLTDEQIRAVAPSIFAAEKHVSRSDRYTYIPTGEVLTALRKEGFEPFMVCQTRVRQDDRRDFTKHMVRMRHATQVNDAEANEIVLLNSHDGTSSYQLISGLFRYVCSNGLVFGDTFSDVRVHHKGQIVDRVIEGAYEVLDGFDLVRERRDGMRAITLDTAEQAIFARAAASAGGAGSVLQGRKVHRRLCARSPDSGANHRVAFGYGPSATAPAARAIPSEAVFPPPVPARPRCAAARGRS